MLNYYLENIKGENYEEANYNTTSAFYVGFCCSL